MALKKCFFIVLVLFCTVNTGAASYSKINPDSYSDNSPEKALAYFLICWQNQDWKNMVKYTQKSWINRKKDGAAELYNFYGFKDLLGVEIIGSHYINPVMVDVTATIHYSLGSKIQKKIITGRVVLERNQWGVNPLSTLRENNP